MCTSQCLIVSCLISIFSDSISSFYISVLVTLPPSPCEEIQGNQDETSPHHYRHVRKTLKYYNYMQTQSIPNVLNEH